MSLSGFSGSCKPKLQILASTSRVTTHHTCVRVILACNVQVMNFTGLYSYINTHTARVVLQLLVGSLNGFCVWRSVCWTVVQQTIWSAWSESLWADIIIRALINNFRPILLSRCLTPPHPTSPYRSWTNHTEYRWTTPAACCICSVCSNGS